MINKNHIENLFNQKFSFLDQKMLEKYLEDEKLNQETKHIIKEQWENFLPDSKDNTDLDHVFYKLFYSINKEKETPNKNKKLVITISRIAAILVFGVLVYIGIYYFGKNESKIISQQVEFVSYRGFRNQFKLPDGTVGWLGYDSKLNYHFDESGKRIANLDGLAYFNVAHDQEHPFIVKTPKKLNIEVLGTKFNVSSYSKENFCDVILEQGKVNLFIQNKNIGEMLPNERVIYDSENKTYKKSNVVTSDYVAWIDGKLILNDNSLQETCMKLSKFYNVDFELQAKEMESEKVRLILEDETLEDALKLLVMIAPVKYEIIERKILDNNSYTKKKIIIKNK